jgi:hypothetical protein
MKRTLFPSKPGDEDVATPFLNRMGAAWGLTGLFWDGTGGGRFSTRDETRSVPAQ